MLNRRSRGRRRTRDTWDYTRNNWPPTSTEGNKYTSQNRREQKTEIWLECECDRVAHNHTEGTHAQAHAACMLHDRVGKDNTQRIHRKSLGLFKRSANSNGAPAPERTMCIETVMVEVENGVWGIKRASERASKLLICWENENVNRWSISGSIERDRWSDVLDVWFRACMCARRCFPVLVGT